MEGLDAFVEIGNIATELSADAWLWAGNFLALIILSGVLLVFAMRSGRTGLVSLILALYSGYALYIAFPYTTNVIEAGGTPLVQAILSVILFIAASVPGFILVRRFTGGGFGMLSIIQNLILSVLTSAFLMALGYHVFDVSNIYTFSQPLDQLFAPEGYFFYWFIAPLVGLFVLIK